MPPKSKKGKGKTVDINTFNEDVVHEDVLDWADDDWNQSKEDKVAAKIAKHREFSRTENNVFGEQESFRTAERLQPGMLGSDLQPPYVAHFGNIRNGTDDEAFLKLFDEGVVVAHHLINQDGKTFALVEFTTADAMRLALLLDGTFQRGRKLYVDLATPKQVERLFQHTGRSTGNSHGGRNSTSGVGQGFSRDSAGQPQPGAPRANSFADLTRDSFGAQQQQSTSSPLLGERASPLVIERSTFGSKMDLHSLDELSRDVLGSAVQPAAASRGGAPSPPRPQAGSPTTALASWRDEEPLPQRRAPRDGDNSSSGKSADASASGNNNNSDAPSQRPPRRREYGSGGFMGGGGNRGSGSAAPSFGGGNWRDEPRAPAPAARRERDDHGGRRGDANNNDDNNSKPDDAAATPTSRDAAPARRGERPAAGARASRQGAAEAPSADNWASLRR